MLIIGSHVGYKKDSGLVGSVKEALSYGANTFMFYTGAPQNTKRLPIDLANVQEADKLMAENNIQKENVIVHAPYIINLATDDEEKRSFATSFLQEEIKRVEALGFTYLVLHPGSHVGCGPDKGIENIANSLNKVLETDEKVVILLETMAGKGTEVGRNFEELQEILSRVKYPEKMGVCLDTCHVFDGGYDISGHLEEVLEEFDRIIGLDKLCAIHLNDSKNVLGSHKDRHECLGAGNLTMDAIVRIINHPALKKLPFYLETPNDLEGYAREIAMLKAARKD